MKKIIFLLVLAICSFQSSARKYQSLDQANPILVKSKYIVYQGKKIFLNAKNIYIDGSITDKQAAISPFVFNSFHEAMKHLVAGTSDNDRMNVYFAPYVYWVDNPDDPSMRVGENGGSPIAMHLHCPYLTFIGLTPHPENVVLACNRGQQQGAYGNFTMFYFHGDGISLNNLTFGNYCNIDLVFPLKPELNRHRRMDAITQAQLAFADGDRLEAHNCRFVSRLNTCPLNGGKRTFFERCHFESTDDAMCPSGVYLSCNFDFYGSMPFGHTQETGAVLLDCDFHSKSSDVNSHRSVQYLIKSRGPISIIDCRYHTPEDIRLEWKPDPKPDLRCYQAGITQNGKPVSLQSQQSGTTVCIDNKPLLDAYKINYQGKTIYNTFNLLEGDDGWDPMNVKKDIEQMEKKTGRKLHQLPIFMAVKASHDRVEQGQKPAVLSIVAKRLCGYPANLSPVEWRLSDPTYVKLIDTNNPLQRQVASINTTDNKQKIYLSLSNADGLSAGYALDIAPSTLPAPTIIATPVIAKKQDGVLELNYQLELKGREDQSVITWYRCDDAKGTNAVAVSISRLDRPKQFYKLQPGDENHYIIAALAPKHIRSIALPETSFLPQNVFGNTSAPCTLSNAVFINLQDVPQQAVLETDFAHFPAFEQHQVKEGYWTLDGYKPLDTAQHPWKVSANNWCYGKGEAGALGYGMLHQARGSRMLYTPSVKNIQQTSTPQTMTITLLLDPSKQAGQGFGSPTGQYFDLMIHYDTKTLSGYGLRIERTTKYANAVDMKLMKYENGQSSPITEPVSTTCFLTGCTIRLYTDSKYQLHANISTTSKQRESSLAKEVNLSAKINPPHYFGIGMQHTGSSGSSALLLHHLKVEWGSSSKIVKP